MKLSKLKQQLMSVNSKRICGVRPEFQDQLSSNAAHDAELKKVQSVPSNPGNATAYRQSQELSALDNGKILNGQKPIKQNSTKSLDSIKIIGITGSRGKSVTAFLVHEYLKALGYKSILYSSIRIDSPASYIDVHASSEIPLSDESALLDIIEEAEAYQADYVVLEVNETAIEKGLVNEIPFALRALTNIYPDHNEAMYSKDEYVKIKKSFFENIPADENCTCVFGLTGNFTREEFNALLKLNNQPKTTYGTKQICEGCNADYTNLDCLLYGISSDMDGLDLQIRVKENSYDFKTNVILLHNAINITCAAAIIEALNLFNADAFSQYLSTVVIPGREEVIKTHNRTIVIGLSLNPTLEYLQAIKSTAKMNHLAVVTGAPGTGFVSWDKGIASERILKQKGVIRRKAMDYLKDYADYVYLTGNDNAAESAQNIAQELQGYLNNQIPSVIEADRKEAIKKAIKLSKPFDLIYLSGRGNRSVFCDTENTVKLFTDKEAVQEALKELGWSYE